MSSKERCILTADLRKSSLALVALALALATTALGQGSEFWQRKDYRQWSQGECQKLLENSPWAKTHTLAQVVIESLQSPQSPAPAGVPAVPDPTVGPATSSTADRSREQRPEIKYSVQFRSALPVRQAMVRLMQIAQKYDQMEPGQKQAIDQNAEQFLAKSFPATAVVFVSFTSNVYEYQLELSRYWQAQTTETLKNSVFLIGSNGERIPPISYVWAGNGRDFQFVFPRAYKDHPAAVPGDKAIQLEFIHPRIRQQRESRVLLEFKLEKMMMQGELVF
jgi:hypothetical protein